MPASNATAQDSDASDHHHTDAIPIGRLSSTDGPAWTVPSPELMVLQFPGSRWSPDQVAQMRDEIASACSAHLINATVSSIGDGREEPLHSELEQLVYAERNRPERH